ncbi:hypothetical protein SteCoe_13217 [Stentor coeruleus]|uniref:C2H2-type domain-containing protein n=1 Tax=Stentor coeruleus TaxID=5963 RepID=A0A1R2C8W7_9CILI|nr:hypothetical protein SteCoe_13217 [Stentor coeruleus]
MQKLPSVDSITLAGDTDDEFLHNCSFCELKFIKIIDLQKHHNCCTESVESMAHVQENDFICNVCNLKFETYRGMRQHYGKIHCGIKKIKCKYCNKRFKDNYAVKYHRKQVHEKSTQVQCYLCSKSLYNKFSFKKHISKCSQKFFDSKVLDSISK